MGMGNNIRVMGKGLAVFTFQGVERTECNKAAS